MSDDRLSTALWVQLHLRRCAADSIPVYVLRKGEAESGLILLKVVIPFQGAKVYTQSRDIDGRLGWFPGLNGAQVPESEADAFIERATRRDPDLWVIEVESRDGSHPFEGKVI
ncbi:MULTISPECIES: DUF1491 family protein [Nitrospirillum]|uniref:DUF1491 domain-containing protein n=1 Tax=Nitrospirillum viridazoti CBAmc TaxID=1441467 RepID=A0A248JQD0_9PROT|nr:MULTISPECIES: DUF1491 family protein [Nitrospirillum]ASG20917.1 hypothetical protein Y958_08880 [Nitrospirillum amazonense CBAmc]MEA1676661.1 DUF1491 family protein [Nitrospirillum sp. BR 11163]TWB37736.1 hypothetical protein FBZ91_10749 [Nitrospirillum amazonense]